MIQLSTETNTTFCRSLAIQSTSETQYCLSNAEQFMGLLTQDRTACSYTKDIGCGPYKTIRQGMQDEMHVHILNLVPDRLW